MNNVIREIKANDAQCYHEKHTKRCIMLPSNTNQKMFNIIKEIKPNDAQCYQGNQTKQCIMLKPILEGI